VPSVRSLAMREPRKSWAKSSPASASGSEMGDQEMHGGVNLELRNLRKTNELIVAETRKALLPETLICLSFLIS